MQDNTTKKKSRSKEIISQNILIYRNRITNLHDHQADSKIALEDYQALNDRYRQKIQTLQLETRENKTTHLLYGEFFKSGINLLTNLKKFYLSANVTSLILIPGSISSEKLIFEENKSQTPKINKAVRLLLATDKDFNEKGTTQIFKNLELSHWVELAGSQSNTA